MWQPARAGIIAALVIGVCGSLAADWPPKPLTVCGGFVYGFSEDRVETTVFRAEDGIAEAVIEWPFAPGRPQCASDGDGIWGVGGEFAEDRSLIKGIAWRWTRANGLRSRDFPRVGFLGPIEAAKDRRLVLFQEIGSGEDRIALGELTGEFELIRLDDAARCFDTTRLTVAAGQFSGIDEPFFVDLETRRFVCSPVVDRASSALLFLAPVDQDTRIACRSDTFGCEEWSVSGVASVARIPIDVAAVRHRVRIFSGDTRGGVVAVVEYGYGRGRSSKSVVWACDRECASWKRLSVVGGDDMTVAAAFVKEGSIWVEAFENKPRLDESTVYLTEYGPEGKWNSQRTVALKEPVGRSR